MRQNGSTVDPATVLHTVASPAFLQKLERFRLSGRHSSTPRPGNTPARLGTQSAGLEIASHRSYSPGDDLRHFDWHAYGRLEQKVIKTFRAERESPLHLLIDTSASMGVPAGDGKLALAAGLAASLAYVALRQHDPVRIVAIGRERPGGGMSAVYRHPGRFAEIRSILAGLSAAGPTILTEGLGAYLRATRLPGLAVILSDFLVPADVYENALAALLARGLGVVALRVIGPGERDPARFLGRVLLRDTETGEERAVDLDETNLALYRAALDDHHDALKRWCGSHGTLFGIADAEDGIETTVLRDLPRLGILQ